MIFGYFPSLDMLKIHGHVNFPSSYCPAGLVALPHELMWANDKINAFAHAEGPQNHRSSAERSLARDCRYKLLWLPHVRLKMHKQQCFEHNRAKCSKLGAVWCLGQTDVFLLLLLVPGHGCQCCRVNWTSNSASLVGMNAPGHGVVWILSPEKWSIDACFPSVHLGSKDEVLTCPNSTWSHAQICIYIYIYIYIVCNYIYIYIYITFYIILYIYIISCISYTI